MIYNCKVPSSPSITGNALPTTKSNHINAAGDVEPCVFIHYSGGNIRYKKLPGVLAAATVPGVSAKGSLSTTIICGPAPCWRTLVC